MRSQLFTSITAPVLFALQIIVSSGVYGQTESPAPVTDAKPVRKHFISRLGTDVIALSHNTVTFQMECIATDYFSVGMHLSTQRLNGNVAGQKPGIYTHEYNEITTTFLQAAPPNQSVTYFPELPYTAVWGGFLPRKINTFGFSIKRYYLKPTDKLRIFWEAGLSGLVAKGVSSDQKRTLLNKTTKASHSDLGLLRIETATFRESRAIKDNASMTTYSYFLSLGAQLRLTPHLLLQFRPELRVRKGDNWTGDTCRQMFWRLEVQYQL